MKIIEWNLYINKWGCIKRNNYEKEMEESKEKTN